MGSQSDEFGTLKRDAFTVPLTLYQQNGFVNVAKWLGTDLASWSS